MNLHFYKDLLDAENESDIAPEDLATIVQGVDDMDDALFGFKPKKPDSQAKNVLSEDTQTSERNKSAIKKQSNVLDFPDEDPLGDISLSDDDFYDVGKKSPLITTKIDSNIASSPSKQSQEKLTKSQKIASLFGLNDSEEDLIDDKKNQDNAADWLGLKDSPVKKTIDNTDEDKLNSLVRKKSVANTLGPDSWLDNTNPVDSKKKDPLEIKVTADSRAKDGEVTNVTLTTEVVDQSKFKPTTLKSAKATENLFDLLDDTHPSLPKTPDNLKDKKSAIFDELFGDESSQKKISRRNSAVKTPEQERKVPTVDEGLGQYTPSSGTNRRPGLGRRRETTPAHTTSVRSTTLLPEDWLEDLDKPSHQVSKKDSTKSSKTTQKTSVVEFNDGMPPWLGGTGVTSEPRTFQEKLPVQAAQEELVEKTVEDTDTPPAQHGEIKPQQTTINDPEKQVVDAMQDALLNSREQSQRTALALQRTEAQLTAALELQITQNSLGAVCERQRRLLDCQERQMAQLVSRQADRQADVERQMVAQQQRIQQLLDVLAANVLPSTGLEPDNKHPVIETVVQEDIESNSKLIKEFEVEVQKVNMENEELRLRMKIMEKHFKLEIEALQIIHRRESESWEDRLAYQKEIFEQIKEELKAKINHLKANEAELVAEHSERIRRLREESADDMKQLIQFHKTTLEQVATFGKLVTPNIREEQRSTSGFGKPLGDWQLSESEEELLKKERTLLALQEKLQTQKELFEKQKEENDSNLERDSIKNEDIARQLKQEQSQLRYKQQQMNQEKKHIEDQAHMQRKILEEMQEKVMAEQTQMAVERLALCQERARLEALAKLQGVSGSVTFDVVQSKAEVHGALEAAREAEIKAIEEGRKLKEKERSLDSYRWKLQEMEEDLVSRAEHLDKLMQVSIAKEEAGKKAVEEAKQLEKTAEEKMKELERKRIELREKEQTLMRIKLDIAQKEIGMNRKREQLELLLPHLLPEEAMSLQPIRDVIDPKMLIMKLRAEKEFEAVSKAQP